MIFSITDNYLNVVCVPRLISPVTRWSTFLYVPTSPTPPGRFLPWPTIQCTNVPIATQHLCRYCLSAMACRMLARRFTTAKRYWHPRMPFALTSNTTLSWTWTSWWPLGQISIWTRFWLRRYLAIIFNVSII